MVEASDGVLLASLAADLYPGLRTGTVGRRLRFDGSCTFESRGIGTSSSTPKGRSSADSVSLSGVEATMSGGGSGVGMSSTVPSRRLPIRRELLRGLVGDLEGTREGRWSCSGAEEGISFSPTSVPRVLEALLFVARSERPRV